jgi:hypothetical protein
MIGRRQTFSVRICSSILSDIWRAASSSRSRCMRSSGVSSCGGAIARESGSSSKLRPMACGKRGEGREEKGRGQAQPGTVPVGSGVRIRTLQSWEEARGAVQHRPWRRVAEALISHR